MEVIPAIDLMNGGCVRLYKGDFAQVTEYAQDPLDIARRYREAGSERLHLVDLDGARSGELVNLDIIRRITGELAFKVQVGGGVRDIARVKLLLDAGADRVVIGSTAVQKPEEVAGWIRELGGEHIVLAFDVRRPTAGLRLVTKPCGTCSTISRLTAVSTTCAPISTRTARWKGQTLHSTVNASGATLPHNLLPQAALPVPQTCPSSSRPVPPA
jgi:imidazole glycerol phosphate synthase subunit HisF